MEQDSQQRKMQEVIHLNTGLICEEVQKETGIVFSKQSIAALANIALKKCEMFASDLEMFTHHARRKKVSPDDVLMLARRTPSLHQHLKEMKQSK